MGPPGPLPFFFGPKPKHASTKGPAKAAKRTGPLPPPPLHRNFEALPTAAASHALPRLGSWVAAALALPALLAAGLVVLRRLRGRDEVLSSRVGAHRLLGVEDDEPTRWSNGGGAE